MIRVLISVEGQTEEAFCRDVLSPHLADYGVYVTSIVLTTKRAANGSKFKGGASGWSQIRQELLDLLADSSATAVTTMYDFYGLPGDVRSFAAATTMKSDAAAFEIENKIARQIGSPRLHPYLQLHEFEALVFAADAVAENRSGRQAVGEMIRQAVAGAGGAEFVNDDPLTAPSKRLRNSWPSYVKTVDGPAIIRDAGLGSLRLSCPHFASWLGWLENLAAASV
jgi:hypothetical protein